MVILLQFLLLFHSLYHELKNRHDPKYQQISLQSRILYIVLQLVAIYFTILDLLRYVILGQTHHCLAIEAYSPRIVGVVYYLIYLYHILLRLNASFKGSYLELSQRNLYILGALTVIPMILGLIIFLILTRNQTPCIAPWRASDLEIDLTYCTFPLIVVDYACDSPTSILAMIAIVCYYAWIPAINTVIGVIFGIKLKKLLSDHKTNNERVKFQYKSLIIKNALLTLVGCISIIVNVSLSAATGSSMFLYFDLFINCVVIGMMFQYNDKWYKTCCKCCIVLCYVTFDKIENKMRDADILEYVMKSKRKTTGNQQSGHKTSESQTDMISNTGDKSPKIKVVSIGHNEDDDDQGDIIVYTSRDPYGSTPTSTNSADSRRTSNEQCKNDIDCKE